MVDRSRNGNVLSHSDSNNRVTSLLSTVLGGDDSDKGSGDGEETHLE